MPFDEKLNFEIHIQCCCQTRTTMRNALQITRNFEQETFRQYIRTYITPTVQYGVLFYGLGSKTTLHEIMVLRKKLIRMASRLPASTRVIKNFKGLKIGTVFDYHN